MVLTKFASGHPLEMNTAFFILGELITAVTFQSFIRDILTAKIHVWHVILVVIAVSFIAILIEGKGQSAFG